MNGRTHGLKRDYHPNGQLAAEISYKNGLQHGTAKIWAADGRFLGEYALEHGTGLGKVWYDNGDLHSEVFLLKGLPTGRQKAWYEDGVSVPDTYWIRGKKVSRKKYFEACKIDSELPRYPETKSPVSRKKV